MKNKQRRIKEESNSGSSLYYPQYKGWFGLKWCYCVEGCYYYERIVCFDSLEKAKKYMCEQKTKTIIKIHEE